MESQLAVLDNTSVANFEVAPNPSAVSVFLDMQKFTDCQRVAQMLSKSDLVPKSYQGTGGLANCVIALDMAARMGAHPLAIMQAMVPIHGRPSWSAQFLIAMVNSCGKFSPLRYEIVRDDKPKEVTATLYERKNGQSSSRTIKETIMDVTCTAWAYELASGDKLEGVPVSISMAIKEGWYSKAGSKWKTMPELMLRYRSASTFSRLYAPEITMGLHTVEETLDATVEEPQAEPAKVATPVIPQEGDKLERADAKPEDFFEPPKSSKEVLDAFKESIDGLENDLVKAAEWWQIAVAENAFEPLTPQAKVALKKHYDAKIKSIEEALDTPDAPEEEPKEEATQEVAVIEDCPLGKMSPGKPCTECPDWCADSFENCPEYKRVNGG